MASGHPDYATWAGKSVGGESITTYSFSGDIAAESISYLQLDAIPTGKQHAFQQLTLCCADDTAIHRVYLYRVSDGWVFYENRFVTSGEFNIVGNALNAGDVIRIYITNNSVSTLTFTGVLTYIVRSV
jgi:hypothetical protein